MEEGASFYERLGRPKYFAAPMVDQSELAFRLLTRRYGAEVTYTPMFHSRLFAESEKYRSQHFTTCPEDSPLIVQFCGNDPQTLLAAARHVEDKCVAVDLNLGCPQGIARKGNYGSFLLDEPEKVCAIVRTLHQNLSVPVTCKVRMLPSQEDTINLCKALEEAGCALLTIHGRTREEKQQFTGPANWEIIREVKQALRIPVVANGGIATFADIERCLEETGADGVMSSEALLENPALFANIQETPCTLALEYLRICEDYTTDVKMMKAHLFKILFGALQLHTDLREEMVKARDLVSMKEVVRQLQSRPPGVLSWYRRHK
jgi:tRNA-dihydrouridine synthase 1